MKCAHITILKGLCFVAENIMDGTRKGIVIKFADATGREHHGGFIRKRSPELEFSTPEHLRWFR